MPTISAEQIRINPVPSAAHIISSYIIREHDVSVPIYDKQAGPYYIKKEKAGDIAEILLEVIAEVHADLIDAGSEREVILEDEELLASLTSSFEGWDGREQG